MLTMYPEWEQLKPLAEDSQGLVPVIVQDAQTRQVLMLGWMNREAFEQTLATKRVTFYSRQRQRLWTKGETSGNYLDLVAIHQDCDADTLLVLAQPHGPTCHTGSTSCFGTSGDLLAELIQVIHARHQTQTKGSYTTGLFQAGIAHIGAKVQEEAEEVARAAREEGTQRTIEEAADVVFHLLVLLEAAGVQWDQVLAELHSRRR